MEEDQELKQIAARKMAELRKRLTPAAAPPKEEVPSDRALVASMLYDRGEEVLNAAYSYYPGETDTIVKELAGLIRSGRLADKISGGELYSVFRQVGLRFALKTSIKVQDRGKFVELSEKLKSDEKD